MSDLDLLIVGSGPAGYAAALRAAELGASTAVVEGSAPGGNCVSFACLPHAILLDTVRTGLALQELSLAGVAKAGESLRAEPQGEALNFARAAARKDRLVAGVVEGIRNQLRSRKVELVEGLARLTSPGSASVSLAEGGTMDLSAAAVVIATGARQQPPTPLGEHGDLLLMDAALRLAEAPASAVALGGGPLGLAFALEQAFVLACFGSQVTAAEPGPEAVPGADEELVGYLCEALEAAGVRVLVNARVAELAGPAQAGRTALLTTAEGEVRVPAEVVTAPDCRRPYFEGLGLEALGVAASPDGIRVDEGGATGVPGVYAAGDVTGRLMLSHAAIQQGRVAAENALGLRSRLRLRAVPRCLHTEPELAFVGLTERQAREKGREVRVGLADLSANLRAVARGRGEGLVKAVVDARSGEILGVHALGPGADEIIGQTALAMELEATVEDVAVLTHWHPSLAEALVEAARHAL